MATSGRPKKARFIKNHPKIIQFSPRGKPGRPDEAIIGYEHFEALRLTDYLGLDQKQAAKSMRISQQTFSRIVKKARLKIAEAVVNGKSIRIKKEELNSPKINRTSIEIGEFNV